MSNEAILVFARRPELGQVKTRLDARIGQNLTLSLYRTFLTDTLIAARKSGAKVIFAHTRGPNFPEQQLADLTFVQRGNGFGERFDYSLLEAAKRLPPGTRLILVGADTPQLSPTFLRTTLEELKHYDAVVGPNDNGGFYLLGFSRLPVPVADVFTHSAAEEPKELLRILRRASLRTALLEPHFDVDLPKDLAKLMSLIDNLERDHADWIPVNTRNLLHSRSFISVNLDREADGKQEVELSQRS